MQNTKGLDAILQALALGGQPLGNLGQIPTGVNPSEVPMQGMNPMNTALPDEAMATGSQNPAMSGVAPVQQDQIMAILQALLQRGGGFNSENELG